MAESQKSPAITLLVTGLLTKQASPILNGPAMVVDQPVIITVLVVMDLFDVRRPAVRQFSRLRGYGAGSRGSEIPARVLVWVITHFEILLNA
jgi:hypothetical protein